MTEHFTQAELERSETARRLGLSNVCLPELLPNMRRVADVLEKIRAHYGKPIHVTSCYRSPEVNKAVGGSPTSAHRFALAADFEVSGVANAEVCEWLASEASGVDFDQVIYEFGPTGWVHIGIAPPDGGAVRRQVLSAVKQGGKTVYLQGIRA